MLVSLLAYEGLRPEEALALEERHAGRTTLLIEQKNIDGEIVVLIPRSDGEPWREHDYRNWRRRVFRPAVVAACLPITRPYDLWHACASLLIHAGTPLSST
jgi:hypothetical protein